MKKFITGGLALAAVALIASAMPARAEMSDTILLDPALAAAPQAVPSQSRTATTAHPCQAAVGTAEAKPGEMGPMPMAMPGHPMRHEPD